MTERYHLNPKTLKPGICKATVRECQFKLSSYEHFTSSEEAQQEAVKIELYKQYQETGYNAIIPTKRVNIEGTYKHSTLYITYQDLVKKIGEPTYNGIGVGDKVQIEWSFRTPYGTGVIHDWKETYFSEDPNDTKMEIEYTIAGTNSETAQWIKAQLYKPTPVDAFR